MFSSKGLPNTFCVFDKSHTGPCNRFQMLLCNPHFYDSPDKCFPTRLASSWRPHWRLCLSLGRCQQRFTIITDVSRRFHYTCLPLALVYCMASHLFWRGLNIHSRINSGYYSCSSAIPMIPIQHTWPALVTRVDQHCITLTNEKKDAHLWYMTAAELFCLRSIRNKAKTLKGTVHPKVKTLRLSKMCEVVSSWEQVWRNVASIASLAQQRMLCSEWVPSEWESKQLIQTSQ